jgi:hypothetical protein
MGNHERAGYQSRGSADLAAVTHHAVYFDAAFAMIIRRLSIAVGNDHGRYGNEEDQQGFAECMHGEQFSNV